MYPELPGLADVALNSPEFPRAVIHLAGGRQITIDAPNASPASPFVRSLRVDGRDSRRPWLPASTFTRGAHLEFDLGTSPTSWGSRAEDAPPSFREGERPAIGFTTPADQAVVAPGQTTTASVGVRNVSGHAETITWMAAPASGITVSPTHGTLRVKAGAAASQPLTVTGGPDEGRFLATFQLSGSEDGTLQPAALSVAVARPGSLFPFFDNAGISDDANQRAANYDGDGFSYSANALRAAGLVPGSQIAANGLTYTWPNQPAGQLDNITASGQTIALPAHPGASRIGFLGSATNAAPGSHGMVTVRFTDGTSQQVPVGLSDWTLGAGSFPPAFGNTTVATMPYRNFVGGRSQLVTTFVFATDAPLTAGRTVASVTLPASVDMGQLHVLAIALG
jgi:hypothetical protein